MAAPTIAIVVTSDADLVADILDLVTGRTQAELASITAQTKEDLARAQHLAAQEPPKS
jgi:hypothetical protein